jgi:protein involved in polysaccharide export with SLBB domain
MTKKNILYFICLNIILTAFFGCEGMAALFHGPKPAEEEPTFTITFEANGAAGTAPEAQTVGAETVIALPGEGALSFSGKVFTGWSVSPSGAGTTYTPGHLFTVSGNQTFYARWVNTGDVRQYTVTFNANGATGGTPPTPQTVYNGISIAIPDQGNLVNTGKNFTGWNTAADGTGTTYNAGDTLAVSSDVTLYAQWVDPSVQRYTVTYHANGASGSPPSVQTVNEGANITLPGVGSLTNSGKTFNGWNTAANGSGTAYAESASFTVTGNTSFYAQWMSAPVVPPGATLAQQLAYIAGQADDGDIYDIVVSDNIYMNPATVSTLGRDVTVIIHSASSADIKSIQLDSAGFLFSVDANITLKLQDITLKGISSNTSALVQVGQGGTLVLETGAKITLNTNNRSSQIGGGVYINGGTMIMRGGEVSENTVYSSSAGGGGIYVNNTGTLTISGGVISGNMVQTGVHEWFAYGGGVYINNNCTATMSGGIIGGNTATGWHDAGGGVYINGTGTFIKRHVSGSSTSGIIYGATGDMANTASDTNPSYGGAALFRSGGTLNKVNRTLGNFDEITSVSDEGWE